MYYIRKMKGSQKSNRGLLIPLSLILIFAVVWTVWSLDLAFYSLGGLIGLYSLYAFLGYIRTRNTGLLVVAIFNTFEALVCMTFPVFLRNPGDTRFYRLFFVGMLFSMILVAYLVVTKRIKWRGREVLELAAVPVEDKSGGYTSRPRPAGQAQVSKDEILRFTRFITHNLIAFAYIEENRVVFVLVQAGNEYKYILGLQGGYEKDTWVAFDFDGRVAVHLSQEDYLNFKDDLDFDQLCQSLSNLFVDFLEMFQRGQAERIIDRMNMLQLPFYA